MKLRRIGAAIMAAAVAVSTLAVSAFAESAAQTENGLLSLITAEIPAEFDASIIYVEGVGLLDISGEAFDSSENGNADADANLDIDFDGIGYVSEKNLEAWHETGVLTFSKLKADFDTEGLRWGMFSHSSEYVQLVKMDDGGEVTYRGVYQITDGEIKKLYDLDTFWTSTRADGVSVGFERIYDEYHVKYSYTDDDYYGFYEDGYEEDITLITELQITVTQADGTKKTQTVAKSNLPENKNIDTSVDGFYYIGQNTFSTFHSGDVLGTVLYAVQPTSALGEPSPDYEYIISQAYTDGTVKEIFKYSEHKKDEYFEGTFHNFSAFNSDVIFWDAHPYIAMYGTRGLFFYDAAAKKLEYVNLSDLYAADISGIYFDMRNISDKIIADVKYSIFNSETYNYGNYEGYALFNNYQDIKNFASKTLYNKITPYYFDDENGGKTYIYLFEDLDGKIGYMDGNEKVLAYFDAAAGFPESLSPVVKDGKAFLIDKDMKAVSGEIEADGVTAINDELFIISKGDKYSFVTYDVEVEDPATGAVMVDYSDDATGIKASAKEGVLEEGAKLTVTAVADKTDENNFTYNISFKVGDKEVQPNGKVTVKIPIPDALKDKTIYVYRVEADGTYTDMKATIEDGYIVFETDHFSEYLVTSEQKGSAEETPGTGFGGIAVTLGVVALAGAAFVVVKKKTR